MAVPEEQLRAPVPGAPQTREAIGLADGVDRTRRPRNIDVDAADFLALEERWEPRTLTLLAAIGQGRAAQARLLQAVDRDGYRRLCVEKVFRAPLLTRFIYRSAFQAPFAYQWCEEAIVAAFYRRRVAATIVETLLPGVRMARPLYVRWDQSARAFALGAEFVNGRGIVPQAVDPHGMRRCLARLVGAKTGWPAAPPEEIGELLTVMQKLERLFHESGLVGSGWQVCKRALVSTANCRRTEQGYALVDLESGMPALLVPSYLLAGLRIGRFPLFDDVDPKRLRGWLVTHRQRFVQKGANVYEALCADVEKLIAYSARWKQGELALARHAGKLFSREFWQAYRRRCLTIWRRRKIIDAETEQYLRSSGRLFGHPTYWLGLIPGPVGRFLQRLVANRRYRVAFKRWFLDPRYRRTWNRCYVWRRAHAWREAGRLAPDRTFRGLSLSFFGNAILAPCTPPGFQRWLSDPIVRRDSLNRAMLLCVSNHFQQLYARHVVRERVREWRRDQRVDLQEAASLFRRLETHDLDEYLRCFGLHMGLKLSSPWLLPVKVGGVAAFVATGNLLYLLPFLVMPIGRTAITLWRMTKCLGTQYGEALLVGMIPTLGNLAYPVQMYTVHPELSTFLIRDSAARAAHWVPVYGGKDTRMEIWFLKLVNLLIEIIEIGLIATSSVRRRLRRAAIHVREAKTETSPFTGRFFPLLERQRRLLTESESSELTFGEWALAQARVVVNDPGSGSRFTSESKRLPTRQAKGAYGAQ